MDQRIVQFAGRLREAGVRVSTSETLNAIEGAAALGEISDRAVFRDALRALLVKEHRDIPTFDTLFERFFGSFSPLISSCQPSDPARASDWGISDPDSSDGRARVGASGIISS